MFQSSSHHFLTIIMEKSLFYERHFLGLQTVAIENCLQGFLVGLKELKRIQCLLYFMTCSINSHYYHPFIIVSKHMLYFGFGAGADCILWTVK